MPSWREILERTDIVGGDLETHEDGDVYRGPIEKIELKDGMVRITTSWCAKMPGMGETGFGTWVLHHGAPSPVSITERINPTDIGGQRLSFDMPMLGFGVIFPKGGSKLDPEKVEGLEIP